jgi:seryl-tRNA synthetase
MKKIIELEMKKTQYIKMLEKFKNQINEIEKQINQLKDDITYE